MIGTRNGPYIQHQFDSKSVVRYIGQRQNCHALVLTVFFSKNFFFYVKSTVMCVLNKARADGEIPK